MDNGRRRGGMWTNPPGTTAAPVWGRRRPPNVNCHRGGGASSRALDPEGERSFHGRPWEVRLQTGGPRFDRRVTRTRRRGPGRVKAPRGTRGAFRRRRELPKRAFSKCRPGLSRGWTVPSELLSRGYSVLLDPTCCRTLLYASRRWGSCLQFYSHPVGCDTPNPTCAGESVHHRGQHARILTRGAPHGPRRRSAPPPRPPRRGPRRPAPARARPPRHSPARMP